MEEEKKSKRKKIPYYQAAVKLIILLVQRGDVPQYVLSNIFRKYWNEGYVDEDEDMYPFL